MKLFTFDQSNMIILQSFAIFAGLKWASASQVRAAVCREGSPLCAFQFDVGNDDGDNAEEGTSMEGLGMVKFLTNLRASFLMLPYGDQVCLKSQ